MKKQFGLFIAITLCFAVNCSHPKRHDSEDSIYRNSNPSQYDQIGKIVYPSKENLHATSWVCKNAENNIDGIFDFVKNKQKLFTLVTVYNTNQEEPSVLKSGMYTCQINSQDNDVVDIFDEDNTLCLAIDFHHRILGKRDLSGKIQSLAPLKPNTSISAAEALEQIDILPLLKRGDSH